MSKPLANQPSCACLSPSRFAALRSLFQKTRFVFRRCFHHSGGSVRIPFFTVAMPRYLAALSLLPYQSLCAWCTGPTPRNPRRRYFAASTVRMEMQAQRDPGAQVGGPGLRGGGDAVGGQQDRSAGGFVTAAGREGANSLCQNPIRERQRPPKSSFPPPPSFPRKRESRRGGVGKHRVGTPPGPLDFRFRGNDGGGGNDGGCGARDSVRASTAKVAESIGADILPE